MKPQFSEFSEHIAAVPTQECNDLHKAEMGAVIEDARQLYERLGSALIHDVKPEDLVIDGEAVRFFAYTTSSERVSTIYLDDVTEGEPWSTAQIEHWSTDGQSVVRITKEQSWQGCDSDAALLANQVTRAWHRIPGVEERRTNKIAQIATSSEGLRVDKIAAANKEGLDDKGLHRLRAACEDWDYRSAQNLSITSTDVTPETLSPLDEEYLAVVAEICVRGRYGEKRYREVSAEDSSDQADSSGLISAAVVRATFEYLKARAAANPSREELGQMQNELRHKAISERLLTADSLRQALEIVQGSQRIRPSAPQHKV